MIIGKKNYKVKVGNGKLCIIAGPCAIESLDHSLFMAESIKKICQKLDLGFVFKACYDKDCRSSLDSFHGVGLEQGIRILEKVREEFSIPVTSDFSNSSEANLIKDSIDLIQVPAYLCRQTSILRAAANTLLPVHLKKGQFMSPWNMRNSTDKLTKFGAKDILLTDRGTFFGYNMLVNDFRSLPIMAQTGFKVGFDATHSIQMPTSFGSVSGGQREFIPHLVRAAVAVGIDCLFLEVHDNPKKAKSDPNTVLDLKYLEPILKQANFIHNSINNDIQKDENVIQ